ncbi:MAG: prephenate dehydratase [Bryobacteraceae bacterium]|nr:prephenate dehydratase [Bryobacteraceae bacterium]
MKKKNVVAFQGERGAFSELAAVQLLGAGLEFLPCERFEQMFRALQDGAANAAVVPIENTLHGSVHENYDHLLNFDHRIVAETSVRIVHNLIVPPGTKFSALKQVYSHPVALNQCLRFFAAHPKLEKKTFYDTAGSVKMMMAERPPGAAAIASSLAAANYGGEILKASIEDDRKNYTRFFLLRRPDFPLPKRSAASKVSLVFTTRNSPGSLFRALAALALRDISLVKIESRPMRGRPWEYLFYLDFLGHVDDPNVKHALAHLGEVSDLIRVLGCYPAAGGES